MILYNYTTHKNGDKWAVKCRWILVKWNEDFNFGKYHRFFSFNAARSHRNLLTAYSIFQTISMQTVEFELNFYFLKCKKKIHQWKVRMIYRCNQITKKKKLNEKFELKISEERNESKVCFLYLCTYLSVRWVSYQYTKKKRKNTLIVLEKSKC